MRANPPPPLYHPFETGALDAPAATDRVLFIGATREMADAAPFKARFTHVQGFRPDFLKLEASGRHVVPVPEGEDFAMTMVVASRHRGLNENWLAQAILRVAPDALVVFAGGATDGVSSLRKRLSAQLDVAGHLAKNHGEVFWLRADAAARAWASDANARVEPLVEGRFVTAPGMFSHDRIDPGSRLLAQCLPSNLTGAAADLCAGWGYLSVALAERAPGIAHIDLFEADHAALRAAEANMAALAPAVDAGFHWCDLTAEPVERRFNVIVMNPPFHQGRAADPGIGQAMIRAASKALKPGGQLFLVANRGLPYEQALKAGFGRVEEIADADGFKVWRARR